MQLSADRRGRRLMEVGRAAREWAREERSRNHRMAAALEDFAASLEQHARLMRMTLVASPPAPAMQGYARRSA